MYEEPIFFERNRVFRVYKGGKLFHDFFGDEAVDGNLPEEWVASNVRALNKNNSNQYEGISKIKGHDLYFDELLEKHKESMLGQRNDLGFLVKILDSAVRLPIQAHPDKAFSEKYFNSEYGKAESWIVLATRPNAKIYFGFQEGITKEKFIEATKQSETNKAVMEDIIKEIPVKAGDVFFIPAKAIHAIGYGCLILEVQEPTDFTIQPETWCDDYRLNEYEMYLGLSPEVAIECFDFETVVNPKKEPKILEQTASLCYEQLIGREDTDCFGINRLKLTNGEVILKGAPKVYVVTDGSGAIIKDGYYKEIQKGDYFFLPYCADGKYTVQTDKHIELVECMPGQN